MTVPAQRSLSWILALAGAHKQQGQQMKLYVGNLGYSVNDSSLSGLFEPFGTVESAKVIQDRDTGSSKGFGFVEMSNADAQKAMSALNGKEFDGRALRVNEAKPQESRTGGGGGGRNRY
jgi:RNA recognition motif-containing protein